MRSSVSISSGMGDAALADNDSDGTAGARRMSTSSAPIAAVPSVAVLRVITYTLSSLVT